MFTCFDEETSACDGSTFLSCERNGEFFSVVTDDWLYEA